MPIRPPRRLLAGALILGGLAAPGPALGQEASAYGDGFASAPEAVVLVHGLGRSRVSMLPLAWALERAGYDVLNWGYSSTSEGIPALGDRLAEEVGRAAAAHPGRRIHFVGHSLGGILIRWVLVHQRPEQTGRVVMLAPPNQGSRYADRFAPWMGWLLRPLPELTTADSSTARALPAPQGVEIGIIAASGDGKVSVPETRLAGIDDHVVVPGTHTWLMSRPGVQRLVLQYLATGGFDAEAGGQLAGAPLRYQ